MIYIVFCLTEGKFRDIKDEFQFGAKKQLVEYKESVAMLEDYLKSFLRSGSRALKLCLLFTFRGETHFIDIRRIQYLEVNGRIVDAHLKDSEEIFHSYARLCELENILQKIGFIRISRFFLVSVNQIAGISGGDVCFASGKRLSIGRSFRSSLKRTLRGETFINVK